MVRCVLEFYSPINTHLEALAANALFQKTIEFDGMMDARRYAAVTNAVILSAEIMAEKCGEEEIII